MANEKNTENQSAFKELVLPVIVLFLFAFGIYDKFFA